MHSSTNSSSIRQCVSSRVDLINLHELLKDTLESIIIIYS